jgi:maltose/moltooligosaccharide transporter
MNVDFFGIQYSFGLQQSAVNPIYDFLGGPDQLNINNYWSSTHTTNNGALSDKTWSPRLRGRRKPKISCRSLLRIAFTFLPFSSSLWMAAWFVLDFRCRK